MTERERITGFMTAYMQAATETERELRERASSLRNALGSKVVSAPELERLRWEGRAAALDRMAHLLMQDATHGCQLACASHLERARSKTPGGGR